ncbi:MAG: carboxypeptidase regulatory-like domain-containing protein [Labilithrix sp.]|nr:carboxypeptidase regulatory-like domain-containing protein [Labilithrix sp.]
MFQPPEDGAVDDPTLPVGTLEIHVVDPSGKPLPSTTVTLGVLYNSVAKGESRKRLSVTTNATGTARLDQLETGSTVAYRPMVIADGATFSVMPFRMPEKTGMRAILHVYPVVESIEQALVVCQSVLYAEVKDDRIQVQQAFKIYNFGKNAWVPKDLVVSLPETFTAFTTQQGMSDVGVDAVPKKGVRIHGTFGPGQHMLEFRWQLPYSGEAEVRFDVGMPPRMAASRVIAPASKDMTLEVPDFPPPQSTSDGMGQRALITEKQLRKEDAALTAVTVVIRGLPTEGPAKVIATLLAGGGLLVGLVLGAQKPSGRERKKERQRLLDELEQLERARLAEEVGPKTYERARRELLDALTRTFAEESTPRAAARSGPRRRAS